MLNCTMPFCEVDSYIYLSFTSYNIITTYRSMRMEEWLQMAPSPYYNNVIEAKCVVMVDGAGVGHIHLTRSRLPITYWWLRRAQIDLRRKNPPARTGRTNRERGISAALTRFTRPPAFALITHNLVHHAHHLSSPSKGPTAIAFTFSVPQKFIFKVLLITKKWRFHN